MPRFKPYLGTSFALLVLAASFTTAAVAADRAEDRWLHVRVHEQGPDGASVELNLPLDLVHEAVPLVENSVQDGEAVVEIGDREFDGRELKALLRELGRSPDGVYLEMHDDGEHLRVERRGGQMLVLVRDLEDAGETLRASIPIDIVVALASGPGDELNIAAALEALAHSEERQMITITDEGGRTNVRLWVDSQNAQS